MNRSMTEGGIEVDLLPGMTVYRRPEIPLESVKEAIEAQGEVIKLSPKSETRRVDEWIVKESRRDSLMLMLKRNIHRERYRRAWVAGRYLENHGVNVPRAEAFVEFGTHAFITGNVVIMDYLAGQCNVERHAADLVQRGAKAGEIHTFLGGLADSVNLLCDSGAYHADLSGKNIFTGDGREFFFIDLDGVVIGKPYTNKKRLKNHVQLYDSFCDFWGNEYLEPFLAKMLPEDEDYRAWTKAVRNAQSARRRRQLAIWKTQGRSL